MIPLSVPNINGNEWKYVKECLDSGWISSAGEYVNKFELAIQNYTGIKYAVACINGTAGLQVSLKLAEVSSNDIVIAPNLTFIATLNAVSYSGAQIALFIIVSSFIFLGLANWAYKKYIKNNPKFLKKFKL